MTKSAKEYISSDVIFNFCKASSLVISGVGSGVAVGVGVGSRDGLSVAVGFAVSVGVDSGVAADTTLWLGAHAVESKNETTTANVRIAAI